MDVFYGIFCAHGVLEISRVAHLEGPPLAETKRWSEELELDGPEGFGVLRTAGRVDRKVRVFRQPGSENTWRVDLRAIRDLLDGGPSELVGMAGTSDYVRLRVPAGTQVHLEDRAA